MSGVGTELGKLIPDWLARQTQGCGCNNWKRKCDEWGVEQCKVKKPLIVQRLVSQKHLLPAPLRVLPMSALKAGATLLVEKAIANAENSTDRP